MAVPVFESFGQGKRGSNGTDVTVTAPAGIQDDDMLLLCVCNDGNPNTFVLPSGFTELEERNNGNACSILIAWKRASGEAGDYTITWTGNQTCFAFICRISGVATDNTPENLGQNSATDAFTLIDPSIPSLADSLVICFFASDLSPHIIDNDYDADYIGIASDRSGSTTHRCSGAGQRRDEATPSNPPQCDWTTVTSEQWLSTAYAVSATPATAGADEEFAEVIA